VSAPPIPPVPPGDAEASEPQAGVIRVGEVEVEPVRWLWPGRIPFGKLSVVDGDPGRGKSTLLLDLAARVSTGTPMPLDLEPSRPAGVVLLSAEDDVASTIRPRLEAAGADVDRVVVLDHVTDDRGPRPPVIPDDLGMVERLLEVEKAALLVVDPLAAFLGAAVDSHRDQDVRRALHRLKDLAERSGAAVVCVRHLNKAGGSNALYRGTGSIGIVGAARAGLLVGADPDDDKARVLAVTKSNLGPEPPSVAFRLVEDELYGVARIVWQGESRHRAGDLLSVRADDDVEAPARAEAEAFLCEVLADGPAPSKQVQAEAREAGISAATLRRAREDLKVRAYPVGAPGRRGGGVWWWSLGGEQLNPAETDLAGGEQLNPDGVPAGQSVAAKDEATQPRFSCPPSEGEQVNQQTAGPPTHRCDRCGKTWWPPTLVATYPHTGCGGLWRPIEGAR
jgi:AAA domain